ncbi:MAG: M20 family metallopeptidase, partial [Clostridiales bacterium]|nr:M20 family metallopeptidase [Clostridiales bacterium]
MTTQDTLAPIIASLQEEAIALLQKWISVPSVKEDAAPDAPFGLHLKTMLDTALQDCARLGLSVRNFDGYAGDAQMGDTGDVLGILALLDVVPPGDGWEEDPYSGNIRNGRLYGRGSSDDKGPAVAALYAMIAIKKAGIPLKKKVRLILGCDEESGMDDMVYYTKHADMPAIGFSPDGSYPVINTEKGRMEIHLTAPLSNEGLSILSLQGGDRANVIPGSATATVKGDPSLIEKVTAFSQQSGYPVVANQTAPGIITITATGKVGHAAFPHSGRNANGQLVQTLAAIG